MGMTGGYSAAELAAAVAQMAGSYQVRTRLHLLDLEHTFQADLSSLRVSDGAVTVQGDQPISRALSIQLVDPTDMLGLTGASSSPTFLLQAWKGIYVDSLAMWVDLPTICAYVSKPRRSGDLLTIEGQDKGALGSFPTAPLVLKKGTNAASAIRSVMSLRAGETRFRLAKTNQVLQRDFVLDDQTTPLALARSIASSIGWRLFYDAEGYCVGRVPSSSPVFTFKSGIDGTLASAVETGYWDGYLYNRVLLDGPVIAGKKITAEAVLPASHPLSPEKLARNGVIESGRRTYRVQSTMSDPARAKEWVEERLHQLAIQQQTATFSSVPVWHLQEHDVIRAIDPIDGVDVSSRWTDASIPMVGAGLQSNGFTRRTGVSFSRARVSFSRTRIPTTKKR